MAKKVLIIHGGAGAREGHHTTFQLYAASLDRIVEEAWLSLGSEGARAAVLHAIRLLEDDPIFNAGFGSRIQRDGQVRMSAALMDGRVGRFSGVVNVQEVQHPIDAGVAVDRNFVDGARDLSLLQKFDGNARPEGVKLGVVRGGARRE